MRKKDRQNKTPGNHTPRPIKSVKQQIALLRPCYSPKLNKKCLHLREALTVAPTNDKN